MSQPDPSSAVSGGAPSAYSGSMDSTLPSSTSTPTMALPVCAS